MMLFARLFVLITNLFTIGSRHKYLTIIVQLDASWIPQ